MWLPPGERVRALPDQSHPAQISSSCSCRAGNSSCAAKIGKVPMIPLKTDKLVHPLGRFGAVPLAREALDEVLAPYRRPNDKVSEWLLEGALLSVERLCPGPSRHDSRRGG